MSVLQVLGCESTSLTTAVQGVVLILLSHLRLAVLSHTGSAEQEGNKKCRTPPLVSPLNLLYIYLLVYTFFFIERASEAFSLVMNTQNFLRHTYVHVCEFWAQLAPTNSLRYAHTKKITLQPSRVQVCACKPIA